MGIFDEYAGDPSEVLPGCDCDFCLSFSEADEDYGYEYEYGPYDYENDFAYETDVEVGDADSFETIMSQAVRTLDAELAKLIELAYDQGFSDGYGYDAVTGGVDPVDPSYDDAFLGKVAVYLEQIDEWAPFVDATLAGLQAQLNSTQEAVADVLEGQETRIDLSEADGPVVEALLARVAELESQMEEVVEELDL